MNKRQNAAILILLVFAVSVGLYSVSFNGTTHSNTQVHKAPVLSFQAYNNSSGNITTVTSSTVNTTTTAAPTTSLNTTTSTVNTTTTAAPTTSLNATSSTANTTAAPTTSLNTTTSTENTTTANTTIPTTVPTTNNSSANQTQENAPPSNSTNQTITQPTNSSNNNVQTNQTAPATSATTPPTSLNAVLSHLPKRFPVNKVTDISVTATGGTPPYTYQWYEVTPDGVQSNPAADCINQSASSQTCQFLPNNKGRYYIGVNVTDASGVVFNIDPYVNVTSNVTLNTSIIINTGTSIATANATGGSGNYSVTWSVTGITGANQGMTWTSPQYYLSAGSNLNEYGYPYVTNTLNLTEGTILGNDQNGNPFNLTDGFYNVIFKATDAANILNSSISNATLDVDWPSGIFTSDASNINTNTITSGQSTPLFVAWQDIGYCDSTPGNPVTSKSNCDGNFHAYTYKIFLFKSSSATSCDKTGSIIATNTTIAKSTLTNSTNGDYYNQTLFFVSPTSTTSYCAYVGYYDGSTQEANQSTDGFFAATITVLIKSSPTLTTTLANSGTISAGQPETDSATLSGGGTGSNKPTGTIKFFTYTNSACSQNQNLVSTTSSVSGDGTYGPSSSVSYPNAGTFYWDAQYSGDSHNNNYTSSCEVLTVTKPLEVTLTAARNPISVGQQVHFSNTTIQGTGGNVYSYSYTCPGVTEGTTDNFTFLSQGTCTITLNVQDQSGETNSSSQTITVTPPLEVTLIANKTHIIDEAITPQANKVLFSNSTKGGTGNDKFHYTINSSVGVTQNGNLFTFITAGTYRVTLHINDTTGEVNQSNATIYVNETLMLNASNIQCNNAGTCDGLFSRDQVIQMTDSGVSTTSGVPPYTYQWKETIPPATNPPINNAVDCGAGNAASVGTVIPCTFVPGPSSPLGQYQFELFVFDNESPHQSAGENGGAQTFLLNASLTTALTAGRNLISVGQQVHFSNTTAGGTGGTVYSYQITGPSGGATITSPDNYTFTQPGSYTVTLNVHDQSGETNSSSQTITVNKTLEVSTFTCTQPLGKSCLISPGQSVTFSNTTSGGTKGNIYSYSGTAVGNMTGTGSDTWTFPNVGTFKLNLNVKDQSGETNSSSLIIQVNNTLKAPVITCTPTTVGKCLISGDQSLKFSNTTLGGTGSDTYTYTGTALGNMTGLGSDTWTFTPPSSGTSTTYKLNINVQDQSGESNSSSITIYVNKTLVISSFACTHFTNDECLISPGQTVTFSNTTLGGTGGKVYTYTGTALGNMTGQGSDTFQFPNAGTYKINLKVNDQSGETNSSSLIIQVNNTLKAPVITCTPTTVGKCLISGDQSLKFSNTTLGGTGSDTYTYTGTALGNMTGLGSDTWTFTPPSSGTSTTYKLNINVQDQSGESNSSSITIYVNKTLVISSFTCTHFTNDECLISPDQTVTFSNTTLGGTGGKVYTYTGTALGNMTGQGSDTFQFPNAGTYKINLKVNDQSGETNSSSLIIQVNNTLKAPVITCTPTTVGKCLISGDQSLKFSNTTLGGTGSDTYTYTGTALGNMTGLGSDTWTFTPPSSGTSTTYKLNINVQDQSGESNSSSITIYVNKTLVISSFACTHFTNDECLISPGQTVTFSNTTLGGTGGKVYTYTGTAPGNMTGQGSDTFQFPNAGTYKINLKVNDQSGETNSSSLIIQVNNTLKAPSFTCTHFTNDECLISPGQTVTFSNTTLGGTGSDTYTYTGTAPGNMTGQGSDTFQFPNAGTYKINLKVNDQSGETNSSSLIIQVNNTLKAPVITCTPTTVGKCLISGDQSLKFSNTTLGGTGSDTYTYTGTALGNMTGLGSDTWTFTPPSSGTSTTYRLNINVQDQSGESNSSSITIYVNKTLVISSFACTHFTNDECLISPGQTVTFSNTTLGGTGSDTYTYTGTAPGNMTGQGSDTFQFPNAGTYKINLKVNDQSGETNSSSLIIQVNNTLKAPVITCTPTTAEKCLISGDQSLKFSNTTLGGTGSDTYTYTGTALGNMTGQGSDTWTFTPPSSGTSTTYRLNINVQDQSGESNSSSITIYVNKTLVISSFACTHFTNDECLISPGQTVTFSNTTLGGTGGKVYTYTGTAPGNMTGQGSDTFQFPNAGTYKINLKVNDQSGETNSSSLTIQVNKTLVVSTFTCTQPLGTPCVISPGQSVTFSNTTLGGTGGNIYSYWGTAVGNMTGTGSDTWTFPNAGTFKLNLNVQDQSGETNFSTTPIIIQVNTTLVTSLAAQRTLISTGQQVHFSNSTSGGTHGNVYSYTYSCDGASVGATDNITFTQAGPCIVTLNVVDQSGESNSSSQTITVNKTLGLTLSGRDIISEGQQVHFSNTTQYGTGDNQYSYSYTCAGVTEGTIDNFTFSTPETCVITLHVTDQTGETNSSSDSIDITDTLGLTLFENMHKIITGGKVIFTNATSGGTGSDVYYYTVNNTNGVAFSGNTATFADIGTYNVTLHVKDFSNETNQSSNVVVVDEPLTTNTTLTTTPLVSRDQLINVSSDGAVGNSGVDPYTYEWLYAAPHHSAFNPATGICEAPTSLVCLFQTNSITQTGSYEFKLQITDSEVPKVTTDSAAISITVTNALTINSLIALPTNSINAGQSVTFENTTLGGTGDNVYTYTFNSLSGVTAKGDNVYMFSTPGSYLVTLSVVDQSGENTTASNVITVATPLTTELFNTSRLDISAGQSVSFSNTTLGGTGGDVWTYFVNGVPTTSTDGSITFPNAGGFVVTLGVKDNTGQIANSTGITLTVTPPLETILTAGRTPISTGQQVHFTNTTTPGTGGIVYSYSYECGGVTEGTTDNFTFSTPGSCTITLNVADASGETNSSSQTILVNGTLGLTLTAGRNFVSTGQQVHFSNTTQYGTEGNTYTYSYTCAGVTEGANDNFTFSSAPETCAITLKVTDQSGETNQSTQTITVNKTLGLSFNAGRNFVSTGQQVHFSNTTQYGTEGNTYTYSYTCAGVTEGANDNFTFSSAPETCAITLKVTDQSGETNQSTQTITVNKTLDTVLTAQRTLISTGQQVHFSNTTQYGTGGNQYLYSYTCVGVTEGATDNFTFSTPGSCTITLKVTDQSGETNQSSQTITVNKTLGISSLTPSQNLVSRNQWIKFSNTTTSGTGTGGNVYTYSFSSACGSPILNGTNGNTYQFNQPTSESPCTVTLTVVDQSGETNNTSTTVEVNTTLDTSLTAQRTLISTGQQVHFSNTTKYGTGDNQYLYSYTCVGVTEGATDNFTFSSAPETCTITLKVTDQSGETNQSSQTITVNKTLGISSLTPSQNLVSRNQWIKFSNTTTSGTGTGGNVYTYSFSSACGSPILNGTNGNTYQFNQPTSESPCTVTLTVVDQSGETNNTSTTVEVNTTLDTSLTAQRTLISTGQQVHFSNTTQYGTGDNQYLYSYTCVGVTEGATDNFTFSSAPETCTITLKVTDQSGETNQSSQTITVNKTLDTSSLTASQNPISSGQWIYFTNSTSGGTGSDVFTYGFSTGCGTPTQNETNGNTWQFTQPTEEGTCTATLHASDVSGETNQSSLSITVTPPLSISISPTTGTVDVAQTIDYTNSTSGGTSGNVYTYSDSPSECAAQTANESLFTSAGTCKVTIYVTDQSGEKANATSTITVNPRPNPIYLSASNVSVDWGMLETINGNVLGGTSPYTYNFIITNALNGNVIKDVVLTDVPEGTNGIFTYNTLTQVPILNDELGYLNVEMIVTDSVHVVVSSTLTDGIKVGMNSNLTAIPQSINLGQSTLITANIAGGIAPYTYNFTVTNSSGSTVFEQINPTSDQTSSVTFTGTPNSIGADGIQTKIEDSYYDPSTMPCTNGYGCEILSNTITVTNTPAPTTTTISNGGGGGGSSGGGGGGGSSGGGGGGGSSIPVVTPSGNSCYVVSPVTQLNSFNVSFGSETIHVVDNFITPNDTGVTIGGLTYTLYENQTQSISGTNATIELTGLSYLPIEDTVTLTICASQSSSSGASSGTNNVTTNTPPVQEVPANTVNPTTTILPTTTIPVSTIASTTIAQYGTSNGGNGYLGLGLLILIILIIIAYLAWSSSKKNKKGKN